MRWLQLVGNLLCETCVRGIHVQTHERAPSHGKPGHQCLLCVLCSPIQGFVFELISSSFWALQSKRWGKPVGREDQRTERVMPLGCGTWWAVSFRLPMPKWHWAFGRWMNGPNELQQCLVMEREGECGWLEAKSHLPLVMLLMDGVLRCSNVICSPSLNGTREVYYIYLNKTSHFAGCGSLASYGHLPCGLSGVW